MSKVLFAAEIAFGSQNRCVSQQELNLLQFATVGVAKLRASPTQIVRRDMLQPCSLATASHYVPDDVLRDAGAPDLSTPRYGSKDSTLGNPSGCEPLIEGLFCPLRNRNRSDMTALTAK
jgi:hypothetical protein